MWPTLLLWIVFAMALLQLFLLLNWLLSPIKQSRSRLPLVALIVINWAAEPAG